MGQPGQRYRAGMGRNEGAESRRSFDIRVGFVHFVHIVHRIFPAKSHRTGLISHFWVSVQNAVENIDSHMERTTPRWEPMTRVPGRRHPPVLTWVGTTTRFVFGQR